MKSVRFALASAALLGTLAMGGPEASAMPAAPAASVALAGGQTGIEDVRVVCGPFRCVRRFGYGPRFYGRGYYGYGRGYYRRPLIGRVIRRVF